MWNLSKINNKTHSWLRSGVFIVNFEQIATYCSGVSIVGFEQLNFGWNDFHGKGFQNSFEV